MHRHTTIPLVFFLARASAQFHRMEFSDTMRPVAANCPATADMPKCAVDCIDTAAADNGCPSRDDLVCQCKNYSKIQKAAEPCVLAACAAKAPAVISIASEICSLCAGIPLAPVMRETIVIDDAVAPETIVIDDAVVRAKNGENYFQWAAEPTGRVDPRRDRVSESLDGQNAGEEAERKKWLTMPRVPVARVAAETIVIDDHNLGRGAKETGRPVPRGLLGKEIQQAERQKRNSKVPRDGMLPQGMTESELKRLNPRGSPELPDFGSDKSPELLGFGGEPSELHSFSKECTLKGSGSMRSCADLPDWDHGNRVKGDQVEALPWRKSNTLKRDVDLIYEQEQERLRQLRDKEDPEKKTVLNKEQRKMNKNSEQRK